MKRIKKETSFRKEIKNIVFDNIISLGGYCQTAHQLERLNLRNEAFPFDWIVCEDNDKLIEALESNFKKWLLMQNLKEEESPTEEHRKVLDLHYATIHQHIFPSNIPIEESYSEVMGKVNRRIERLIDLQNKNKSILFVRTNVTLEEAKLLEKVILNKFGDKAYLLIINHTNNKKLKKIKTSLSHTLMYEIYDENKHTGQRWQGYNLHWDKIFSNIKVKDEIINLSNDSFFENFYPCEFVYNNKKIRWSKRGAIIKLKNYVGCKCNLTVTVPHSINFKIKDIHNNIIIEKNLFSSELFEFEITRKTRCIKLEVDNYWSPCDKYGTEDDRQLGICVKKIVILRK